MRIVAVLSALIPFVLLTASGCGSEGSEEAAAASVGVQVDPPSARVDMSGTVAFRATVTGLVSTAVSWSVDCGSITPAGVYTAPQTSGTCRVTASVASGVSGAAVVNVGVGGWDAACAGEPEPTSNIVYACDCQAGAEAGCTAGADTNSGTSKSAPVRTWSKVAEKFRGLPAGGTVALCKGGRWNADVSGYTSWLNTRCTPSAPCTLRDYSAPWGGTAAPQVSASTDWMFTLWGDATNHPNGYRFLNLRLFHPAAGGVAARNAVAFRALDNVPNVEVCNCDIDGFGFGFYVGDSGASCRTSGWRIRGNRITNSCTDAMLVGFKDAEIDGNYFDNNGHALCGSYDLSNQSGGTTHTIYLDGRQCPEENVRVVNNEFRRNAVYQGYPQGSMLGVGAGGARNVVYENNLIDWAPCHPTMPGVTFVGGNDNPAFISLDDIVIRRNRILHCRGRAMSFDSAAHTLIENNTIIASGPVGAGLIYVPQGRGVVASSAVIRNNTIFATGNASGGYAIWATDANSSGGNVVTGNSITFTGSSAAACFRVSSPSLVALMDNNQCSGATSYATNGNTYYSLAEWRSATNFDANSIMPSPTGLFVSAPSNLTPAVGSPLVGAASTRTDCTVLGVGNQPCSSPTAIGSPSWSPLDGGLTRSAPPSIGALDR